ncbi:MAG TPA: 2-phospho-L-lactate transferase [Candidatus Binatia bacterium]
MVVVLTGGTGGAKLIEGLVREHEPAQLTIICNTADDLVLHGLNISPDLDTIMYTLAGLNDREKGWGVAGDSFTVLEQLSRYGTDTWFKLGDKDIATHLLRTGLFRAGRALSDATRELAKRLAVKTILLPMTDQPVETRVVTADGEISFQEFFVKLRWEPDVKRVYYDGIDRSRPAPGVLEAIAAADKIIICPSNPVTSIGPILAVPGVRDALKAARAPVVGVSPMIGNSAVSGPAAKLMRAQGVASSATGIAALYRDFLDALLFDKADAEQSDTIRQIGVSPIETSVIMRSIGDKFRLAREVLAWKEK